MYIISGWTNLKDILIALDTLGLYIENHIIWKYNFGVYTKKKFVSSHYHILYVKKCKEADTTFVRNCRFSDDEKDNNGARFYTKIWKMFGL